MKVAVPPAARVPYVCGNGVPEVVPSEAVFRVRLVMVPVPVLCTVTVKR